MKEKEKRLRESAIKSDKLVEQLEKALAESMIEVAHLKEVSFICLWTVSLLCRSVFYRIFNGFEDV